jgi:adenosylmethionine-8-amino-7-oxononanoate aminotransferase
MEKIAGIAESHSVFAAELKTHPSVENVRQSGTILAFDIYKAGEERNYFHSFRDTIYNHFLQKGILLRPLGNTLYILPPYCISKEELQWLYGAILEFLDGI